MLDSTAFSYLHPSLDHGYLKQEALVEGSLTGIIHSIVLRRLGHKVCILEHSEEFGPRERVINAVC